ncbi:unnamed protein product, partial [Meganyctiphanes norvegica]
MAENSRFLTHFYVTIPICSPSRASIMTGRYPVRTGVYPNVFDPASILGLPRNETTIAHLLSQQGYRTMMTGKWHLGVGYNGEYLPTEFGFDEYLGVPYSHDGCPCITCFPNAGPCFGTCGQPRFVSCPLYSNTTIVEQPVDLPSLTQKYVDHAKNFIQRSNADGEPFFLYMPFNHVHHPQFADSSFYGKSQRGAFGDALIEMDWAVGQLLKTIKDIGADQDTIVWFTSDNGPELLRHERGGSAGLLRCGKGTTMEGGIRVPTIVQWPGKIMPGRSNALTSTMDILPTLATLAGVETKNLTIDGVDITSVLMDPDGLGPRDFLAQYSRYPNETQGPYAVFHGKFKAHFWTKGESLSDNDNYDPICRDSHELTEHEPPLLFDLFKDPGERYDLSKLTEYQDELEQIINWRSQHMAEVSWMPPRTQILADDSQPCCNP